MRSFTRVLPRIQLNHCIQFKALYDETEDIKSNPNPDERQREEMKKGQKLHPQLVFLVSQSEKRKMKVADQQMTATYINAQFFSSVSLLTLSK
jgi:hypothetical protein